MKIARRNQTHGKLDCGTVWIGAMHHLSFPQGERDRLHEAVHEPRHLDPLQEAGGGSCPALQLHEPSSSGSEEKKEDMAESFISPDLDLHPAGLHPGVPDHLDCGQVPDLAQPPRQLHNLLLLSEISWDSWDL